MDKSDLLATLQYRPAANTLTISPQDFAGPARIPLAQLVAESAALTIDAVLIDSTASDDRLTFTGKTSFLNTTMSVKAVFSFVGDALARYYLLLAPPENWTFASSFPTLAPAQTGPGTIALSPYQTTFINPVFIVSLNRSTLTDVEFGLSRVALQDGVQFYTTGLRQPITATALPKEVSDTFPYVGLRAPSSISGLAVLAGDQQGLLLRYQWPADDPGSAATPLQALSLIYRADLATSARSLSFARTFLVDGSPLTLEGRVDAGAPLYRIESEQPLPPAAFVAILTQILGLDLDLTTLLPFDINHTAPIALLSLEHAPEGLTEVLFTIGSAEAPFTWEAADGLSVRNVDVMLSYHRPKRQTEISLSGKLVVAGIPFEIRYEPGPQIIGELQEDAEVALDEFIASFFNGSFSPPGTSLRLKTASLRYSGAQKDLLLSLAASGAIDIFGNGQCIVREVGFDYGLSGGQTTRREFIGFAELFGVEVEVNALYEATDGWTIGVEAWPATPIKLASMLETLLGMLNVTLPVSIPDVEVAGLQFEYQPQDRSLALVAKTIYHVSDDNPLFGDQTTIATRLNLTAGTDPQTGRRDTAIAILWDQQHEDYQLTASVAYSAGSWTAMLEWEGQEGETITLASLHKGLKLDQLFDLPDDVAWDVFAFKSFRLEYQGAQRGLKLLAKSRLAGMDVAVIANLIRGQREFGFGWSKEADVGIVDVLKALNLEADGIPMDLSNALSVRGLRITYRLDPQPQLVLTAESQAGFYQKAFVVGDKGQGRWDLTLGATFANPDLSINDVPWLKDAPGLSQVLGFVSVRPHYVLYSSTDQPRFAVPDLLSAATADGVQYIRLSNGLTLAATLQFDANNVIVGNVKSLIGVSQLHGSLNVSTQGVEVVSRLPTSIELPVGDTALRLQNASFLMQATRATVSIGLGGTVQMQLAGQLRALETMLIVGPTEAAMNLHVVNGDILADSGFVPSFIPDLPIMPALPGVQLDQSDYYVQLGVNFTPPAFNFGFTGQFHIGTDPAHYRGRFTFVLQIIEGIPNPLYLALGMDEIDLWGAMEAQYGIMSKLEKGEELTRVVEGVTPDSSARGALNLSADGIAFLRSMYTNLRDYLHSIHFKNVFFHWADSIVILPNGKTALPGVGFQGVADIFGFRAYMMAEFGAAAGSSVPALTGHAECDPIELGSVLRLSGKGKGILADGGTWKPGDKLLTGPATGAKGQGAAASQEYLIKPGGPVVDVNLHRSPYLTANLELTLFQFIHQSVTAVVSNRGLEFELNTALGEISKLQLNCRAYFDDNKWPHFEANGAFAFQLDLDIPVPIDMIGDAFGISGSAEHIEDGLNKLGIFGDVSLPDLALSLHTLLEAGVNLTIGAETQLVIDGHFEFEGAEFTLPRIELTIPVKELTELSITSAKDLTELIIDYLRRHARTLFADLFEEIIASLMGGWKQLIEFIENTGKVIKEIGEAGLKKAAEVIGDAKKAVEDASQALKQGLQVAEQAAASVVAVAASVAAQADQVLTSAKDLAETTVKEVAHIATAAVEEAQRLFEAGKAAVTAAVAKVTDIALAVGKEVQQVLNAVADLANEAARQVGQLLSSAAQFAGQLLGDARQVAAAVLEDAKRIVADLKRQAEELWNEINKILDDIAREAQKALEATEEFFEDSWDAVFG